MDTGCTDGEPMEPTRAGFRGVAHVWPRRGATMTISLGLGLISSSLFVVSIFLFLGYVRTSRASAPSVGQGHYIALPHHSLDCFHQRRVFP